MLFDVVLPQPVESRWREPSSASWVRAGELELRLMHILEVSCELIASIEGRLAALFQTDVSGLVGGTGSIIRDERLREVVGNRCLVCG